MEHLSFSQPEPPPTPLSAPLASPPLDRDLPYWARRSNPVVRRELGAFWKRLLPDFTLLARVLLAQVFLLMLPFQFLMTLTMPITVVAVFTLPVLLFLYLRVLLVTLNSAAEAIVNARANHTLDLLRVTLIPLEHIVLGKIAASVWQRIDDLDLVLLGVAAFAMPFLAVTHMALLPPNVMHWDVRLLVMGALLVLPLRLLLELFMMAAVAVAFGTVLPSRAGVVTSVGGAMVFYYLFMIAPLMMFRTLPVQLALEVLLPLGVPLLVSLLAVRFAVWRIRHND